MFLFSRLEQFQILVFDSVLVVFSNSGMFLVLVVLGNLLLFQSFKITKLVPSYGQALIETLLGFINNIVYEQIGTKG
jgi:F0F1-type ATP synthase membrane subunit a